MKKISIFIALILLIMLIGFLYFLSKNTNSANEGVRSAIVTENIKRLNYVTRGGASLDENKAKFEQKLLEFLYVAVNDTSYPMGMETKYDLLSRKNYFSSNAWDIYLKYINQHKTILEKKSQYHWAIANYLPNSQTYEEPNRNYKLFCSLGSFYNSTGDNYWPEEKFKLKVKYSLTDFLYLSDLKILSWQVQLFPKHIKIEDDGCNY